ncbi:MAG: PAS domain-containing sensor histidine kinase [Pseudomonadota bacterium]
MTKNIYQQEIAELKEQVSILKKKLRVKKNKTKQLKYKTKAFETIYKHSKDGIWLLENGKFIACNKAVISMLGYDSEQQVLNLKPSQFSPEFQANGKRTSELAIKMINMAMNKGQHRYKCEHTRANGEDFLVDVVLTRLVLDGSEVLHVAWRDISKQKKLEEEIIKERDIANQANKAKSEFLANMSHELRTPMHGILSFVNMGLDKPKRLTQDKTLMYFSHIKSSADRLLAMLNDLLDLSKLESGKMEMNYSENSLMQIANDCITEQQARLSDLKKQIIWEPTSIIGNGVFDPVRIGQVITNLISNAIKFCHTEKTIQLSITEITHNPTTGQEHCSLLFSVRDYGRGIPNNELELIFDKFSQSSTTKVNSSGTGLGLAISKEIIGAHSGKIWAENHSQSGAIFKFTIPKQKLAKEIKKM